MFRSLFVGIFLAAALAACCGQAVAQLYSGTRHVEGVVRADRKPLEGAVVKLENPATLQIRSFITQADGKYMFNELADNITYELTAEHDGYESDTASASKFDSSKRLVIDFNLSRKQR